MTFLQVAWFLLVGVLFTGYAILDGFDLGVGFWHLFVKKDEDRRILLNAIGPVWDGNEVWLLTGGGALFAAFPPVYATVFSGFYLAMVLLLAALIVRAVAIEFRSHTPSPAWRKWWDVAFAAGSVGAGLLLPVALGNILRGVPLDGQGNYLGSFLDLLSSYALAIGATGLAAFATHGALYIALKSDGELRERALGWAGGASAALAVLFTGTGLMTIYTQPHLLANFKTWPVLWLAVLAATAALFFTGFFTRRREPRWAFVLSALTLAGFMGIVGASLFPRLVPASNDFSLSLTLANSSSSPYTLRIMLIVAAAGMPVVIAYTVWIYRTFKGKVRTDLLKY